MFKKTILITMMTIFVAGSIAAQQKWSLERCVKHAQQNSLETKQSQLNVRNQKLSLKEARNSRLPNVSASTSLGNSFGRRINPVTNDFEENSFLTNGVNLSVGVPIYQGGFIKNSIKQSELNIKAAEATMEQTIQDIGLGVAQAYLNVLLNEEQLEVSKANLRQTQQQLKQTDRLIQAGILPKNDRLDIIAQIARQEQNVIMSENAVELTYLQLKDILQLEPDYDLELELPDVKRLVKDADTDVNGLSYNQVYRTALSSRPEIRAGEYNIKSAAIGEKLSKASMLPSISFGAGLSSNYVSGIDDITYTPSLIQRDILGDLSIDGGASQSAVLSVVEPTFIPENNGRLGYIDQLSNNFGQNLFISINIPIYDKGSARINAERARINVQSQEIQLQQTRQRLKSNVQQAIASAQAAKKRLEAAKISVEAQRLAFENAETRFSLGAINSLELTTAQNNLDLAESEIITARYDYIFKVKIVDFYMGKVIKL